MDTKKVAKAEAPTTKDTAKVEKLSESYKNISDFFH